MAPFLSKLDRQVWLAGLDRDDEALLEFARALDDLCVRHQLRAEHAAVILLRAAAGDIKVANPNLRLAA